jgi:hypothetical protein
MNNDKIYAGCAEKDFALRNVRLDGLKSVIYYIAHYLVKTLSISGINKRQHFVKAFSACPAYIITDYRKLYLKLHYLL